MDHTTNTNGVAYVSPEARTCVACGRHVENRRALAALDRFMYEMEEAFEQKVATEHALEHFRYLIACLVAQHGGSIDIPLRTPEDLGEVSLDVTKSGMVITITSPQLRRAADDAH